MSEIEDLNKRYVGIIKMPGAYVPDDIEYIPTGSLALDFAIGNPGRRCGFPKKMITTIWGKEGSGKSTLGMSGMASAQAHDERLTGLINTELRQDFEYAKRMGVDLDRLALVQQDAASDIFGEQISDAISAMAKSGDFSYLLLDSVAALEPKNMTEAETAESQPGLHARLVRKMLSRVIEKLKAGNTALVITTQRIAKFGARSFAGPAYEIVGGNRLKFYSSLLLKTAMIKQVKDGDNVVGIRTLVDMQKNIGMPFAKPDFCITDGLGIDWAFELFDLGKPYGIAYNKQAWYYYTDPDTGEVVTVGQGRRKAVDFIRGNPEIAAMLQARVVEALEGEYGDKFD
jgi:recombination protein RecA